MTRTVKPEQIQSAHFCPPPAWALEQRAKRGRKAEGLRYERKVQAHMEAESEWYLAGPWLIYIIGGRPHWCQPDGLHFDVQAGIITIIEIKYSHTTDAYWQLRHLYSHVLGHIFPDRDWTFRLVEVVKWYDPAVKFPEPTVMCPDPLRHASESIGVHIWKP